MATTYYKPLKFIIIYSLATLEFTKRSLTTVLILLYKSIILEFCVPNRIMKNYKLYKNIHVLI
jgi:hypothetical protein